MKVRNILGAVLVGTTVGMVTPTYAASVGLIDVTVDGAYESIGGAFDATGDLYYDLALSANGHLDSATSSFTFFNGDLDSNVELTAELYQDTNGNGLLDVGTDELLDSDVSTGIEDGAVLSGYLSGVASYFVRLQSVELSSYSGSASAVSSVPVPMAAWLFGSALVGAGVFKRKKKTVVSA